MICGGLIPMMANVLESFTISVPGEADERSQSAFLKIFLIKDLFSKAVYLYPNYLGAEHNANLMVFCTNLSFLCPRSMVERQSGTNCKTKTYIQLLRSPFLLFIFILIKTNNLTFSKRDEMLQRKSQSPLNRQHDAINLPEGL